MTGNRGGPLTVTRNCSDRSHARGERQVVKGCKAEYLHSARHGGERVRKIRGHNLVPGLTCLG